MNDHPASSPICRLALAGQPRRQPPGATTPSGTRSGSSTRTPLQPMPGGAGVVVDAIVNPHLRRMVRSLMPRPRSGVPRTFPGGGRSALENIDPEGFAEHTDLALLMGRPIAVARARLGLELKGEPAVAPGWNSFRMDLRRPLRDTDGFTRVAFPVRIGEFEQFNDGLVGYWVEPRGRGIDHRPASSPQGTSGAAGRRSLTHGDDPVAALAGDRRPAAEPDGPPRPPRKLHATSGIQPVKAIDLPPRSVRRRPCAIEVVFLSSPVLTPAGDGQTSPPVEPGYPMVLGDRPNASRSASPTPRRRSPARWRSARAGSSLAPPDRSATRRS